MQKDVKTATVDFEEISSYVHTITGEQIGGIIMMGGRQENVQEAR